MLTLLGGLLGIAATRPVVYYFHHNPIRFQADLGKILEDYGFEAVLPASTDWQIALTHGIIVVVLGLLVSAYAAVKILKIHPVKAMHS
jgi:ABC-type antimicrobial peptide transport system permease subunit